MVHAYMLDLDIKVEVWQDQPLVVVSRKNLDGFSSRGYKCSNMDRFLVCELVGLELAEPARAQLKKLRCGWAFTNKMVRTCTQCTNILD